MNYKIGIIEFNPFSCLEEKENIENHFGKENVFETLKFSKEMYVADKISLEALHQFLSKIDILVLFNDVDFFTPFFEFVFRELIHTRQPLFFCSQQILNPKNSKWVSELIKEAKHPFYFYVLDNETFYLNHLLTKKMQVDFLKISYSLTKNEPQNIDAYLPFIEAVLSVSKFRLNHHKTIFSKQFFSYLHLQITNQFSQQCLIEIEHPALENKTQICLIDSENNHFILQNKNTDIVLFKKPNHQIEFTPIKTINIIHEKKNNLPITIENFLNKTISQDENYLNNLCWLKEKFLSK